MNDVIHVVKFLTLSLSLAGFFARFSHPVIQRVNLVRRKQPIHVGNGFTKRDVLLLFTQLLQIQLVQLVHVRFEFGGILGERALLLDVAPYVV